jgi:hypothetical protein
MKTGSKPIIVHDARTILELPACRRATAVDRMAHRWFLEPASAEEGRPDVLLGPRFAGAAVDASNAGPPPPAFSHFH